MTMLTRIIVAVIASAVATLIFMVVWVVGAQDDMIATTRGLALVLLVGSGAAYVFSRIAAEIDRHGLLRWLGEQTYVDISRLNHQLSPHTEELIGKLARYHFERMGVVQVFTAAHTPTPQIMLVDQERTIAASILPFGAEDLLALETRFTDGALVVTRYGYGFNYRTSNYIASTRSVGVEETAEFHQRTVQEESAR